MEEQTTVVIDIQLNDEDVSYRLAQVNREMEELRKENAAMRKSVKDGTKTWEDVSIKLADNEAKLKSLKAEQSALTGQVAQATQGNRKYGTSLKEQSALLNDLRNRYQSLNEEQRNSDGGKAMLKQIQDLDASMKNSDATMGLFQRNVGDYANSIIKALGLTGPAASGATKAIGLVGNAAKSLIAIPVIAVITAVILVIKKVVDAIKGSEEQTMRMKEALAVFQPLIIAVKNGFSALANILITVVEGAIKGVTLAMEGLARAADWVGSLFGQDWGLTERTEEMKAAAAAQMELTRAENEYIIQKRQWSVESAKIDRDVAELRAKSADKERYTAEERKQFLTEAQALEARQMEERKRLAAENLRLLQERAAQTENSTEDLDKLAEAEVALINVEKEYNETLRGRLKEQQKLDQQIRQESIAAAEAYRKKIEELRKAHEDIIKMLDMSAYHEKSAEYFKKQTEKIQQYNEYRAELLRESVKINQELAASLAEMPEIPDLTEAMEPTKMEQFAAAYQRSANTIEGTSQQLASAFGTVASIYQQLADDETKSEEERAKAAKKARRWSAIQIAANSATAMAKGIAGAMDTPFPANLVSLSTTVAALLSAIAQAKALATDGFYTGGVIGGFHGASMGPDNTVIAGRKGELVLNANQQRNLFDIANGVTSTPNMAALIAEAVRNMPAPVLEYSEFTRFTENVKSLDYSQQIK